MFLKRLSFINFKNYRQQDILFEKKINCFTGLNGSGKTNILDAIYYCAFCKSHSSTSDIQSIHNGESFFVIEGDFNRNESNEHIVVSIKKGQRKIVKRNKKEYPKLAEHIGLIPLVIISPFDHDLISGASEYRRKFMDIVISQFNSAYLYKLIAYNKNLIARNKLLKQIGKSGNFDKTLFEVLDEQLSELGNAIYAIRNEFIDKLVPVFDTFFYAISQGKESPVLKYKSQLQEKQMLDLLHSTAEKDTILQYTSVGIHRDDLQFMFSGQNIKKIGSQGQQKTFLIALKLAQYEFISTQMGIKPLLLLDDLFDKLDYERISKILSLVSSDKFGQIFITDTNHNTIDAIMEHTSVPYAVYKIEEGQISPE